MYIILIARITEFPELRHSKTLVLVKSRVLKYRPRLNIIELQ